MSIARLFLGRSSQPLLSALVSADIYASTDVRLFSVSAESHVCIVIEVPVDGLERGVVNHRAVGEVMSHVHAALGKARGAASVCVTFAAKVPTGHELENNIVASAFGRLVQLVEKETRGVAVNAVLGLADSSYEEVATRAISCDEPGIHTVTHIMIE